MYYYKAHYFLDCDNGIEKAIVQHPPTPEEILEDKQLRDQLYAAVMELPDKQAKWIYARFYLGIPWIFLYSLGDILTIDWKALENFPWVW